MAKAKKITDPLIGTQVTLRADLKDIEGQPHSRAGETLLITEKAESEGAYWSTNDRGHKIMVHPAQWAPAATPKDSAATTDPIGTTVRLLASLTLGKKKHPYAGQLVTVIGPYGPDEYSVETTDEVPGKIFILQPSDWEAATAEPDSPAGPVSAEVTAQLQTINLYTDPANNKIEQLLPATIHESPFNPRTNYPEADMVEMTESAKVNGITSAILVRPRGDDSYEIVFGHRRHRAAVRANLPFVPAIVRELTDAESAQLQAVENTQRKDLDPIDEGMGFAAFIKTHNITKDECVRRIGRSRTHVYNRLKLATLHEAGQQALRSGRLQAEVATLIARVSGEKQQAHALKLILDGTWREAAPDELMTVSNARGILREKFTLGLKDAIWDKDDTTLVESAGACTVCPKRSGVDPIVFTDLLGDKSSYGPPKGENVCTDPECFDLKKTAQLKRNQTELEAKGKTVVAGNKARQAISASGEIKGGYIPLKEVKAAIKAATAKGKPAPTITTITIQDPRNGKTHEVAKLDEVEAAGVKVAAPKTSGNSNRAWTYGTPEYNARIAKEEEDRKKEREKNERTSYSNIAVFKAVRAAAMAVPRNGFDLKMIAYHCLDAVDHWERGVLELVYEVKDFKDLWKRIETMDAEQLGQLIVDCAMTGDIVTHGGREKPDNMLAAAKHYGVDVEAVRKAYADEKKAEAAAEAAAAAATGEKPTATKAAKKKGKGLPTPEAEEEQDEFEAEEA